MGKKPYICTHCGKAFSRNQHPKCHMSTHTGVKPYQSRKFDKNLSDNINLISHLEATTGVPHFKLFTSGSISLTKLVWQSSGFNNHLMNSIPDNRISAPHRDTTTGVPHIKFTSGSISPTELGQ